MGCVLTAKKNISSTNEISLASIPKSSIRQIKSDSFNLGIVETNNSKVVHKNNNETINNLSSLNSIKYNLQLKNGREIVVLPNQLNKLFGAIKGFLFRKKYEDYLKTQLLDHTNELYFEFIILVKNYRSSKLINNKSNEKIKNILKTSWEEFYIKDPTILLKQIINKVKKYSNGLIFKYKEKSEFDSSNISECLENVEYCYKGYVDIITNKKTGYGELIYKDGRQYIGNFYDDKFCGWNILVNNEGIVYVGLFNQDALNGKGLTYNTTNDYLYRGDFVNFEKNGYGEEVFNGVKYVGEFEKDKKNGKGEIILKNNDIYKGKFADDKMNGKGKYIWDGKKREYNGYFVDGKMNGKGLLIWDNNKFYNGRFNNGVKEGKAEIGFINGEKYLFEFKNDLPFGKGYEKDKDNNILNEVFYDKGKIINKDKKEIIFLFD